MPRRPKTLRRTAVRKAHKPTIGRGVELLWAHEQVTNLTSHVLTRLGPRNTIDCVHEMMRLIAKGSKENQISLLSEIIDACFRRQHRKQVRFTTPFREPLSLVALPIPRSLRVGTFRKVALMILRWYQLVLTGAFEEPEVESDGTVPTEAHTDEEDHDHAEQGYHWPSGEWKSHRKRGAAYTIELQGYHWRSGEL